MPKNYTAHEAKCEGVKLVGSPSEMINLMIEDNKERVWATTQIEHEGPKHKQIMSALMLKRLYKLIRNIERASGTKFEPAPGYELIKTKDEVETLIPLTLVVDLGSDADKQKVAECISIAPEHESLAFAMYMQAIEWAIKATAQK
jgi:hypothetical protein